MLKPKIRTQTPQSGLRLVNNQQHSTFSTKLFEPRKIVRRGYDHASGTKYGFGDKSRQRTYGLAVDRVLEYRVVVPTGQFLVANECQNTDLYFALRGGGGETFGAVMEVVTLAFPRTPVRA